jgi:hypothetical protein
MNTVKKIQSNKVLWNIAFFLTGVIIFDNFLVLVSFLTSTKILPFVFPASILITLLLSLSIGKKSGLNTHECFWSIISGCLIILFSFIFAAFYFDLSVDGQWYHQPAIYHLASDWNPIFEPLRHFDGSNDTSIEHFPKSTWYYAASVYSTFGNFEAGKSLNVMVLVAGILVVYAASREFGISGPRSLALSALLALNPVIWSEITTYLVDGDLVLYLSIIAVTFFTSLRNPNITTLSIGSMAAICLINTKFTGLVFFCFFAFCAFLYFLFRKREYLLKFISMHIAVMIIALFAFGFNPYVTNTIKRGNPLYPIIGTAKYPSATEQEGSDGNEVYETPINMRGKGILTRLFYANFSRPGNAPYNNVQNAKLMIPFSSKISEWSAYHYHETRTSGFGPYYSGILIFSLALLVWILFVLKKSRIGVILACAAVISTLFVSKHMWWPRFAPQMWFLPVIPVVFSFWRPLSRIRATYTWVLAILIAINGIIVLYEHMEWETRNSIHLYKQLSELKKKDKAIEVYFGYFEKSGKEKLSKWGIKYTQIQGDEFFRQDGNNKGREFQKLTSMVEGYPLFLQILYRETGDN